MTVEAGLSGSGSTAPAEEVRAEIVGLVVSVEAMPGQAVEQGQMIVLMESMKMEIPVPTESAGILTQVLVRAGDTVKAGDLLAVVRPASGPGTSAESAA